MTDNEKRAHDVAICMLQFQLSDGNMKAMAETALGDGRNTVGINVDDIYMRAYEPALRFFNKKFPSD